MQFSKKIYYIKTAAKKEENLIFHKIFDIIYIESER